MGERKMHPRQREADGRQWAGPSLFLSYFPFSHFPFSPWDARMTSAARQGRRNISGEREKAAAHQGPEGSRECGKAPPR
jgi:hypothetical protein